MLSLKEKYFLGKQNSLERQDTQLLRKINLECEHFEEEMTPHEKGHFDQYNCLINERANEEIGTAEYDLFMLGMTLPTTPRDLHYGECFNVIIGASGRSLALKWGGLVSCWHSRHHTAAYYPKIYHYNIKECVHKLFIAKSVQMYLLFTFQVL